jgi:hypothetical protein
VLDTEEEEVENTYGKCWRPVRFCTVPKPLCRTRRFHGDGSPLPYPNKSYLPWRLISAALCSGRPQARICLPLPLLALVSSPCDLGRTPES